MRKISVLALVLALVMLFIAACGAGGDTGAPATSSPEPQAPAADSGDAELPGSAAAVSITHFWSEEDAAQGDVTAYAFWDQMKLFIEENPNITVNQSIMPHDDYQTVIQAAAAADDLPDVFVMKGSWMENWVTNNLVMPITDILPALPYYDKYRDGIFSLATFRGDIYGIPFQAPTVCSVVYYNAALWAEAGYDTIPDTWEGIFAASDYFNAQGITTVSFGNRDGWPFNSCYLSTLSSRFTGTDWFWSISNRDGAAGFTDQEFVDVLQFAANLGESGVLNPDFNSITDQQASDLFAAGLAATTINGEWVVPYLITNADEEVLANIRIAIMPQPPVASVGPRNGVADTVGWFISLNSKLEGDKLETAKKLIFDVWDEDYSEARVRAGSEGPHFIDVDRGDIHPLTQMMLSFSGTYTPVPVWDAILSGVLIETMNTGIQEIMAGTRTPESVVEELQAIQAAL